ncbi:hypothetical protein HYH03_015913 [Edaphochlamys debaryana]|uniref:F-box domain-containing protein n=1 Tax=Edaphochlamys debaryana TaxID=47281 RepID=A0A835XNA5_9CHLO|nr:hypothetical protein HYH03_015913 [Edaphochlamys debaryana]|eukprot:KAG2485331.1 hypothetical protein HYH03_015913 [Edaphochlamys debaryana]
MQTCCPEQCSEAPGQPAEASTDADECLGAEAPHLPPEVVALLGSHLTLEERLVAGATCRAWRSAIHGAFPHVLFPLDDAATPSGRSRPAAQWAALLRAAGLRGAPASMELRVSGNMAGTGSLTRMLLGLGGHGLLERLCVRQAPYFEGVRLRPCRNLRPGRRRGRTAALVGTDYPFWGPEALALALAPLRRLRSLALRGCFLAQGCEAGLCEGLARGPGLTALELLPPGPLQQHMQGGYRYRPVSGCLQGDCLAASPSAATLRSLSLGGQMAPPRVLAMLAASLPALRVLRLAPLRLCAEPAGRDTTTYGGNGSGGGGPVGWRDLAMPLAMFTQLALLDLQLYDSQDRSYNWPPSGSNPADWAQRAAAAAAGLLGSLWPPSPAASYSSSPPWPLLPASVPSFPSRPLGSPAAALHPHSASGAGAGPGAGAAGVAPLRPMLRLAWHPDAAGLPPDAGRALVEAAAAHAGRMAGLGLALGPDHSGRPGSVPWGMLASLRHITCLALYSGPGRHRRGPHLSHAAPLPTPGDLVLLAASLPALHTLELAAPADVALPGGAASAAPLPYLEELAAQSLAAAAAGGGGGGRAEGSGGCGEGLVSALRGFGRLRHLQLTLWGPPHWETRPLPRAAVAVVAGAMGGWLRPAAGTGAKQEAAADPDPGAPNKVRLEAAAWEKEGCSGEANTFGAQRRAVGGNDGTGGGVLAEHAGWAADTRAAMVLQQLVNAYGASAVPYASSARPPPTAPPLWPLVPEAEAEAAAGLPAWLLGLLDPPPAELAETDGEMAAARRAQTRPEPTLPPVPIAVRRQGPRQDGLVDDPAFGAIATVKSGGGSGRGGGGAGSGGGAGGGGDVACRDWEGGCRFAVSCLARAAFWPGLGQLWGAHDATPLDGVLCVGPLLRLRCLPPSLELLELRGVLGVSIDDGDRVRDGGLRAGSGGGTVDGKVEGVNGLMEGRGGAAWKGAGGGGLALPRLACVRVCAGSKWEEWAVGGSLESVRRRGGLPVGCRVEVGHGRMEPAVRGGGGPWLQAEAEACCACAGG